MFVRITNDASVKAAVHGAAWGCMGRSLEIVCGIPKLQLELSARERRGLSARCSNGTLVTVCVSYLCHEGADRVAVRVSTVCYCVLLSDRSAVHSRGLWSGEPE